MNRDQHTGPLIDQIEVLHVITRSDWGGAARVVQLLANNSETQAEVACGTGGELIEKLDTDGISVHEQPFLQSPPDPKNDIRALHSLARLISQNQYDIIHCHSTKAGFLGRIAAQMNSEPSVFTVHGWGFYNTDFGAFKPILKLGERLLSGITDAIVCVSHNDFTIGHQHSILNGDRSTVIHNGIPPLEQRDSAEVLKTELDIDDETAIVGSVARLAPQKRPLDVVKIGQKLREDGYDAETVLIGSGPLSEQCSQYIAQHDIEGVHLLGFRDDALRLASEFDVFLIPSEFEGLPISILEAMHLGIPVVGSNVGGIPELVQHGKTGYVVEKGNIEEFVDRVGTLLEKPSILDNMSEESVRLATSQFSTERMVNEYDQLYRSIVNLTDEGGK